MTMMKTQRVKVQPSEGKSKRYVVRMALLPDAEFDAYTPEMAVEAYRTQFSLSAERPYKNFSVKEIKDA